MLARLRVAAILLLAAGVAAVGWFFAFASRELEPPRPGYEFTVKAGMSLRARSRRLAEDGLLPEAHSFWILARRKRSF